MSSLLRSRDTQIAITARMAIFCHGGALTAVDDCDTRALRLLLDLTRTPRSLIECEAIADRETLDLLLELSVLTSAHDTTTGRAHGLTKAQTQTESRSPVQPPPVEAAKVLMCVCGSPGAIQSPGFALSLKPYVSEIDVMLTRSALKFVTPLAFSCLGVGVWTDAEEGSEASHIRLASKCTHLLVVPASAHMLFRIAHASCSDIASLVLTASRRRAVIAPAMNEAMWDHPGTQRNIDLLIDDGHTIILPAPGYEVFDVARSQYDATWCAFGLTSQFAQHLMCIDRGKVKESNP